MVRVTAAGERVTVQVSDGVRGFDPPTPGGSAEGVGLQRPRAAGPQRLGLSGGTLAMASSPSGGTSVPVVSSREGSGPARGPARGPVQPSSASARSAARRSWTWRGIGS